MRRSAARALGALILTACAGQDRTPPGDAPATAAAAVHEIAGHVWYWVLTVDPVRSWSPADPARYTLELLANGTAQVLADCNRGHGAYALAGGALELGPLATTRMACPPGTLAPRYLTQLAGIRRVARVAGLLRAELLADSGTMWFAADRDARLASYVCADARRAAAIYTRARVRLLAGPDALDLRETESGSTLRYRAGETSWFARGDLATLERAGEPVLAECRVEPKRR